MIRYIAVAGTHGARRAADWDSPHSLFAAFLRAHGCEPIVTDPVRRYAWSTTLDGIDGADDTWDAAGRALAHYLAPPLAPGSVLPARDTFIIAHSHGGNVVALAAAKYGLKMEGLITVGTPVRGGRMKSVYAAASLNIRRHLHIYSRRDWWQVFGGLFDGSWGVHRKHLHASRNDEMPKGHGDVLRDSSLFPLWIERGWIDYWRGAGEVAQV